MTSTDLQESFVPRPLVRGGHLQTLWRKFAPFQQVEHRRERLELADGDFIDLDWHRTRNPEAVNNGTIVLILHGLCGCSQSSYVQSLQYRLGEEGLPSVAMNFRGCSGEVNRLARAYHSGVSDDLAAVFEYLFSNYSGFEFAVVGYSLGANVLLKWLGESARENRTRRAVAVSTPFNLGHCSKAMLQGLSQYYGRYFLRRLVQDFEAKKQHFSASGDREQLEILRALGDLRDIKTLWDFDDRITAPLHGFRDAEDYYGQCSSINFLDRVKVPTLLIQSSDDPIIPRHALPDSQRLNENIRIDLSASGGHVGFASAHDPFWLENRILRFIRA